MKLFSLFLSIHFLSLSIASCSDRIYQKDACKNTDALFSTIAQQDDCCVDSCSPFCACACCGCQGSHFITEQRLIVTMQQAIQKKVDLYSDQLFSFYVATIWQPPKLS